MIYSVKLKIIVIPDKINILVSDASGFSMLFFVMLLFVFVFYQNYSDLISYQIIRHDFSTYKCGLILFFLSLC